MKLLLILAAVTSLVAQAPTQDPLLRWMDHIAQQQLDAREKAIAAVHSAAGAEKRKLWVRARILESLGGLPTYDGPLHARITGSIKAEGYTIEKVIYQSLPGYYVTANVYRPNAPGRYAAVLLQSGHTQEGKSEPQLLAANLALKGFVALSFDPVGQGEREQTYDSLLKAPAAGWSVPEHVQGDANARLIGQGVARYFIWDAKRSIDYLVSRQDVDADRIGAAGCSGGGALTTFIGALDLRLKAVIPACFPNSYRLLFTGSDPHAEMTIPQEIFLGLDTADFVELSAPTPWLIQATEQDYFTPPAAKLVYEEARRWYTLYGAEDKVGYFVGPGGHGTPLVSREAVYKWFIRWLKNGDGDFHEQPAKLYTNQELLVTRTGRVEDEPGNRKLYQLILNDFHAKRRPGTTADLLTELRNLQIPTDGSAPAMRTIDESDGAGFHIQHIAYESEPGIEIDARLYVPTAPGKKPAVLLLSGKLSDSLAERIAQAGRLVIKLEPRHGPGPDYPRPYVGDWLPNTRADLVGRVLPTLRAHDILRGVDLLVARKDVDPTSIRAAAQGVKGIWLLFAAASDSRIGKVWLDKTPYSLAEALENSLNTSLFDAVIPGFVLRWDLADIRKAMGDRNVLWSDPVNWMGRLAPAREGFQYRYVLGDLTDRSDAQDNDYLRQLLQ